MRTGTKGTHNGHREEKKTHSHVGGAPKAGGRGEAKRKGKGAVRDFEKELRDARTPTSKRAGKEVGRVTKRTFEKDEKKGV